MGSQRVGHDWATELNWAELKVQKKKSKTIKSKGKQKEKTRADCCSDRELLVAKFRLKLKKVGKTTRPFRYDLNQIPYDYTMKVTNRFKGLDLTDRVPDSRQWSRPSPRKTNAKKAKWLSEEALQIAVKRREAKSKGEKGRYTHLNAEL